MIEFIIGILGMLLVLAAFVLEEFDRKFNQETYLYNLCNIIGAGMLVYYGYVIKGWPFVFLNMVWCLAALVKLVKIFWKKMFKKY